MGEMGRTSFPNFPAIDASDRTGFAGNRLDRIAEARTGLSAADIGRRAEAGFYLFSDDHAVLAGAAEAPVALHDRDTALALQADLDSAVLLGFDAGAPRLAAGRLAAGRGVWRGPWPRRAWRSGAPPSAHARAAAPARWQSTATCTAPAKSPRTSSAPCCARF